MSEFHIYIYVYLYMYYIYMIYIYMYCIYVYVYTYIYIYIHSILSPYTSIFVGESHPSDTMSSPAESWSHLRCQSPLEGRDPAGELFCGADFLGMGTRWDGNFQGGEN